MTKRIWMCAGAILALSCWMFAQNITATLSGTVTDPSGAVVPGAVVTAVNNANAQTRTVTSSADGAYAFTLLPPGTYTVTVKKAGFQTFSSKNVVLNVGELRGLPIRLKTGAVTQTVEVSTTTAPVQLATGAQISTISGRQIRQLELDNRNFEQLVALQPGVSSNLGMTVGFGMANTTNVAVDGTRQSMNNWTVDGADINDTGSNSTILNVPSVDALAEFSIAGSGYSAKYGRSGGGQINVVTKSGTNQFHGDAYEFVRNTDLDANDYFSNSAGGTRGVQHYNDFGFTFGGPLVHNNTFFFVSEEWRKVSAPSTYQYTLPNPQILTGNFTGLTYIGPGNVTQPVALNAASAPAGCITGNVISSSCFSSNAKAYLANIYSKFTPAPGTCGASMYCYPYTVNLAATNNTREDLYRLDQNVGQSIQLFARYMGDNIPTTEPGGLFDGANLPGVYSTATDAPGRNLVLHATMEMTPNLVNDAAFNYSWGAINSNITGIGGDASGFAGLNTSNYPTVDPYNRIPGISLPQIAGVSLPAAPYHERNIDKQVYDNLTWTRGNHTISVGVTSQDMYKSENAPENVAGTIGFGNEYGNPGFANFLLGYGNGFSAFTHDIVPHLHFTNIGGYVEDDWKATPTLTLNLGVRYQYLPTPYDSTGILVNFDPLLFNPGQAPAINSIGNFVPGGVTPANYTNGIIVGDVNSPWGAKVNPDSTTDFAPRLGFSWDPFGHGTTAVRGGWGMYFDRTLDGIWEQNQFTDPPVVQTVSIGTSATTPIDLFDNVDAGAASVGYSPSTLIATGNPTFRVPRVEDWSVSVEHQFGNATRLQVAYVGNHASYLLNQMDLNQIRPSTLAAADTGCLSGGTPVATGASPTSSTCPELQAMRPYVGYSEIETRLPSAISNYNSLQVSLKHQVGRLTLDAAYTYASDLSDASSDRSNMYLNTYNPMMDYGPVTFNRPQVFVLSYIYDLPNFGATGWLRNAVGGWEVSGITTLESGTPITVTQFADPFNCDDFTAHGGLPCPAGTYPGGIGIDYSFTAPRPDAVGVIQGPKLQSQWFNTAAYATAEGHFGNSGTGTLVGPGMDNWDMALMKNFGIGERLHAQIRGEFFNAFNHVNFNSVNSTLGSRTFGQLNGDQGPRQVQIGLKLIF